jgi:shikimate dehydrogenase
VEGGWKGFNTDGYGLRMGIRETLRHELAGKAIILLGAGGAARGAAVECLARGCASLAIGNRSAGNREALLDLLRPLAGSIPVRGFDPASPVECEPGALVINATSAGLKPGEAPPIDLAAIPRPLGIYDMIYNPPRTALLQAAETLGIPAANGLTMLVHQGAKALEIWSGVPAEVTAPLMERALR